jgi:hypothetical protein
MDTGVEFMDNKLHNCESCTTIKLKAYLHSDKHPINFISK